VVVLVLVFVAGLLRLIVMRRRARRARDEGEPDEVDPTDAEASTTSAEGDG
jgi:hypothetical protein